TAPACPDGPPPCTRTRRSYWFESSVTSSGAITALRCSRRGKYWSSVLPLIQVLPSPGRRITRATDVLRLPVPRYCAGVAPIEEIVDIRRASAPARRADALGPHRSS